jgi:protein-tyrosine phosphatase
MTRISDVAQTELKRLCLGASDWILLEPPFGAVATGLDTVVGDLQGAGHRVLIAHPERCVAFRRDPTLLEDLVSSGALTSITSGSLVGAFGEEARLFALTLVREDLVHNVASDAHDLERRPPLVLEQSG